MWDKVFQFRKQAEACRDRAATARIPIDGDAWLKLAEDWLALAKAHEAAEQNPPDVSGRSASD